MNNKAVIVVVNAGSNSPVAAAYLAKAGKSVLVLEKNGFPHECVELLPATSPNRSARWHAAPRWLAPAIENADAVQA